MRDERWNMSSGIIFLSLLSLSLSLTPSSTFNFFPVTFLFFFSCMNYSHSPLSLFLSLSLFLLNFHPLAQFLPSYFSSRKDSVWERWRNGMKKGGKKNWVSSFTLFHLLSPFYFIFFIVSSLSFYPPFPGVFPSVFSKMMKDEKEEQSGEEKSEKDRRKKMKEEKKKERGSGGKRKVEVHFFQKIWRNRERERERNRERENEIFSWEEENVQKVWKKRKNTWSECLRTRLGQKEGRKRNGKEDGEKRWKDLHTKCLPFFFFPSFSSLFFFLFLSIFFPSRNHSIWKCKTNNTHREMKCRQNHALVNFAKHSSYG